MSANRASMDFECPYQRACPHMDGISAKWAFSVFREHRRLEEQDRLTEQENDRLRAELVDVTRDRDQINAKFLALHRKQFKAKRIKKVPPETPEPKKTKKRGPPIGHPPWQRPVPAHVDKTVSVAAPIVCPHCACDHLSPSTEIIDQIQEDIVIQPRPLVTCFQHDTAFCPKCRRPVYATAPGELRNCSIGPTTKAVGVWLHHQLKLPFRQTQDLFATLFGMSFVPASALNFSLTATDKSQPLYDDLREKIRAASLLHLDETSWRLDGLPAWLWYAVYDAIVARWRQTCLAHILRTAKKLFTFLKRPGIPPTNNHAERALRGPVISRKISFGSRSEAGAHAFAVLASLIGTARRQSQPVLKFLHTLFTADIDAAQAALYKNSA